MAIAGLEIGLPRGEVEVTPAWLTAALQASGALPPERQVTQAACARIGEGVGLLSLLYRLTLTYDAPSPGAPASVVLKLPTVDPTMRYLANSLNAYGREVKFYREIAASAPFAAPGCHAALIDPDSHDFVLLLEDVSGLRGFDQITGCAWAEAEAIADVLADFHAAWHGDPRLPEMAQTFWSLKNPVYPVLLPAMFTGGWAVAREALADQVSPELRRFGDHWGALLPWFADQLAELQTLAHGDFRADNLFGGGERLLALDFQIASVGPGVYDLAYFVSQSLSSECRAGRDRDLVRRYLHRLADHGIILDEDETWRLYQLSLAWCLIYPMAVFQSYEASNERGQELMRTLLFRCASAIEETGALDCIPAEAWNAAVAA